MFDTQLRQFVDKPLNSAAVHLARAGLSANALTCAGALVAIAAALAILGNHMPLAVAFIIASRTLDGLDGAVARINGPTAWGGYLDSLADYVFYVSVPVAFGLANPTHLVPALLLVASFTLTVVSFLAYAAIAAYQMQGDNGPDRKAFLYSVGLMEGGETILFFLLFCIFPQYFPELALAFAALCLATIAQRIALAAKNFS